MSFGDIFSSIFYEPLYNALVLVITIVPRGDVGIAIILLTFLVRGALLPLAHKSVKTQQTLRRIDPEIKRLREKHKENQEEQARAMMNLYKEHGINPFSGCASALVQFPVIIALYWVFWKGLAGGNLIAENLYFFVPLPDVTFIFLGMLDVREKSILLAVLAALSQFVQIKLSFPPAATEAPRGELSFGDELKRSMGFQMRYVLPGVIFFVSIGFPAAVPLYWCTSNLFSIGHELLVRRRAKKLLA